MPASILLTTNAGRAKVRRDDFQTVAPPTLAPRILALLFFEDHLADAFQGAGVIGRNGLRVLAIAKYQRVLEMNEPRSDSQPQPQVGVLGIDESPGKTADRLKDRGFDDC